MLNAFTAEIHGAIPIANLGLIYGVMLFRMFFWTLIGMLIWIPIGMIIVILLGMLIGTLIGMLISVQNSAKF